jgi:hypothetical protein
MSTVLALLVGGLAAVAVVNAKSARTGFFTVESQMQSEETYLYRLIERELGTVCYYRHASRMPPIPLGCVKYTEPPAQPRKL